MSEGISQIKPPVWLDITQLMKDATLEMEVGQLIQRENFGLFEAMSAIEMDSGMNSEAVHTLEERIAMGTIPVDSSLSVQHLLGVMDKLLVCESMWFTGNTLAQTLLTCLYVHNISLLKNPYLSLYCRLMLKTDEIIRLSVMKADVHEEEDFTAHTFGLALGDSSSEVEVAKAMKEMEEDLISKIKKSKGELNDPNIKPLQEDSKKEEIYCEAMLARLRFRKNFYLANLSLDKNQCKGLEQASKYISSCKSLLEVVKSSMKLGEVPDGVFDPAICRRLQSPTPIRVLPFISVEEAISIFSKIFSQLEEITSLTKYSTLQALLKFFISFVSTGASILPRARLMNLFYSRSAKLVFGTTPISELVITSMKSFAVPNRYLSHITDSHLLEKISTAFTETFRILCLNRARQRRKIPRHFDDWKNIQDEGSEVDEILSQTQSQDLPKARYLSCWILDQIVQLMTHYLQLGFDLDLYYDEDFPMLYWYLDYLFGVQYQNEMYVKQLEIDIHQLQKAGKKKKAQKKNKPNKKAKNAIPGVEQHLVEANIALCRGIFRLIFAVLTLKNLKLPSFPLGADDLRFYHRFACFHKLSQPGPLHFNHYKENTDVTNVKPEQLFSLATDSLKQSKTSIEKILHSTEITSSQQQELRALAKVCISNLVQIQLISSQSNGKSVSYDFNVHSKYPVVSIKS